jgi:hypothetical protein
MEVDLGRADQIARYVAMDGLDGEMVFTRRETGNRLNDARGSPTPKGPKNRPTRRRKTGLGGFLSRIRMPFSSGAAWCLLQVP